MVYELKVKPGIRYEPHPCFARSEGGSHVWHLGAGGEFPAVEHPLELGGRGTRELRAADLAYQIKRMANPLLQCPIFSVLARCIDGFEELSGRIGAEITRRRAARREAAGALYNQERDEAENPIWIDLREFDFAGVEVVDEHTLRILLKRRYPQFRYWLAMPFFAPVPWEVDRFFVQPAAAKRNMTLDRFPVGTGPYSLTFAQSNWRMVLSRNPSFAGRETYPTEGMPEDERAGLLADAGEPLPFIDEVVFVLEKEGMPRWQKFLQGYYDDSGIGNDVFDQAVDIGMQGPELTDFLVEKDIRLVTSASPTVSYFSFNMLDDVVGGLDEPKCKLRRAISIAFDIQEYIQIYHNGRAIPAMGPIPPQIKGHEPGREGMNPYVYDWDEAAGAPRRKHIDEAKRLLAEAGYPGGVGRDGRPLVLYFDTTGGGAGDKAYMDWMRKQFAKLGIQLQIRTTDYSQFQDKVLKGNCQIVRWGWIADYPDPENFLFLLYGPNGKVRAQGENTSNYSNPRYNELFERMENMEDSPERQAIIREMLEIARADAPWIFNYFPVSYGLYHEWFENAKPMTISRNSKKYHRIDVGLRKRRREEWNEPVTWPFWLLLLGTYAAVVPGAVAVWRRQTRGGRA
ncbi:MAG: ABC transporter substrate-binding protein [Planctomycetota bacterium]